MTTLLLGRDGQVGWQLQRSLAPHGPLVSCSRAECDLADPDSIRHVLRSLRPSLIVNAAAYTAVDKVENDREMAFRINAEAPGIMAEEAARLGALLIHYSTDYVFDGLKATAYIESDPVSPQSAYGESKLAGEEAIRTAQAKSLIFRTSWVFGARGANFVKTILRLAAERESLDVVDDQVGIPTPAALIASVTGVVVAMLRRGALMGEGEHRLYHLAAANPVSWCGFARAVVQQASRTPGFDLKLGPERIYPISTSAYPSPTRHPSNSRLDCQRLASDFGLEMPDWQPYLERMMQLLALKKNGY